MSWTLRFRGANEAETLAHADAFFRHGGAELGISREEFFARLVLDEDGKAAVVLLAGEGEPETARPQRSPAPFQNGLRLNKFR